MRIILSIYILMCFSLNTYSQLTTKAIDDLVERSMKAFDVPGIAVGIIKDGKDDTHKNILSKNTTK
ncbi:MAG: hypothetical protein QM668_02080, partial [Agriterribacter sp.]